VFSVPISLWVHRRLFKDFVNRDLRARYVGSTMGFFWSIVFPILNLAVYVFVFRLVLKTRWSDSQGALEVALFMLAGIIVWSSFAETLSRSTNSLIENANLIKKVVFPSELLPPYLSASSLINMTIGMPVLIAAVSYFGYVSTPNALIHVPEADPIGHVYEGDHLIRAKIHMTRGYALSLTVPLEYSGTATLGEDYVGPTEVVIPAGAKGVWLNLATIPDAEAEGELIGFHEEEDGTRIDHHGETVIVRLGSGGRAGLVTPGGSVQVQQTFHLLDSNVPAPETPVAIVAPDVESRDVAATPTMPAKPYHPLRLGVSLICLPLFYAAQFLFMTGLGYLLATLNAFVRDVFHLVGVGTVVWMFSTPIFYPAFMVQDAGYGWMLDINPMYWLIDSYRVVLIHGLWPDWALFGKFAGLSAVVFFAGAQFFKSQKSTFPDLL
jgi:ABC-type polysaccharide/polyol phosphate export permease